MTGTNDRWALLIGINRYPKLDARYQLNGCVNDVELLASLLRDPFGFPGAPDHLTILRDEQATRDAILAALQRLAEQIGENDIVVLGYSGHGSRRTDLEGDEPDGYDETIVPSDSGRAPYPNRDITDDELYAWLQQVTQKTPYVTLLMDCCHSGTLTRDPFGAASRWVETDDRPPTELPLSPVPPALIGTLKREMGGPSGWLPIGERYVLLAGCRDDESSYEHQARANGQPVTHGALTYFLAQELLRARPGATYRDVFERVSAQVSAIQPRQHPQLEGARNRELFGVRDIAPLRYVTVLQRAGERVTLAAGAAHGMTAGSRWTVYAQAVQRITPASTPLGRVEIVTPYAVSAEARVVEEEQTGLIAEGSRAVEEAHAYGEMRMRVELQAPDGSAVDALRGEIERSALLRLAAPGEPGDMRAYLLPPRAAAAPGDPVPQLGALPAATWAVVGQDGRLALPAHRADEPGVAALLRDNLEKAVRYRQVLALHNPDPDNPLRDKLQVTLKRQTADGSWDLASPEEAGGQIMFSEGDRIAVEIANHHDTPLYLSVLDLGLTGAVSLLYPISGASEPLAPGRSLQIGVRRGDEVELYLPDNFPYTPDPTDSTPIGGLETFKLLATAHEADFSLLVQGGYRNLGPRPAPSADTPLGQLLTLALTGQGTRNVRRTRLPPDEAWTTVERSFFLRRRAP